VFDTLGFIAGLRGGAQVIFDYANPRLEADGSRAAGHEALAARVAAIGEPFASFFETDVLCTRLRTLGFTEIEDIGPAQIAERFFPGRLGKASDRGGHVVRAARIAPSVATPARRRAPFPGHDL
jgi:O-methyltransferase involved in polyketide biosynthesis